MQEVMVGRWRCTLLAAPEPEEQEMARIIRVMRSWGRLQSFPRRAEVRRRQQEMLQEELKELKDQKPLGTETF